MFYFFIINKIRFMYFYFLQFYLKMSRLQLYYNTHFKSLYLSKFIINKKNVSKINLNKLQIKLKFLKKQSISLDLKWLFFFFITNQWPLIIIQYNLIKGKKNLILKNFETILRKKQNFFFLDNLNLLVLINLENWSKSKKNFNIYKNNKELIFIINNIEIFWEFEFLIRSKLKIILEEAENSLLIIKFLFKNKQKIENINFLRMLGFPATLNLVL